jgi:rare lipoprotein A
VENGRSVVVRINDRGPFKDGRLVDLSYAAAYKLRLVAQGSGMVEVEAIDTSYEALQKNAAPANPETINAQYLPKPAVKDTTPVLNKPVIQAAKNKPSTALSGMGFYVQVGAFKNDENSVNLLKRMESYQRPENIEVVKVYNKGIYRVKVGPYATRTEADAAANQIRKQFSTPAIVQN